jgi:hypothetical protein
MENGADGSHQGHEHQAPDDSSHSRSVDLAMLETCVVVFLAMASSPPFARRVELCQCGRDSKG